jgi:general secretion pathway protein B
MSFILDALRKSEHERERRALPGLVEAPVARGARPALPWILAGVGVLLLINVAGLGYLLWRPAAPVPVPAAGAEAPVTTGALAPAPMPTGAARVRPLAAEAGPADPTLDVPEPPPVTHAAPAEASTVAPPVTLARAPPAAPSAPLLRQLPAAVASSLPPLNLDLHVYSPVAAQRFVIVNGQRLREGSVLREGLNVEQITPDGVVLNHHGTRFTLSHD